MYVFYLLVINPNLQGFQAKQFKSVTSINFEIPIYYVKSIE